MLCMMWKLQSYITQSHSNIMNTSSSLLFLELQWNLYKATIGFCCRSTQAVFYDRETIMIFLLMFYLYLTFIYIFGKLCQAKYEVCIFSKTSSVSLDTIYCSLTCVSTSSNGGSIMITSTEKWCDISMHCPLRTQANLLLVETSRRSHGPFCRSNEICVVSIWFVSMESFEMRADEN